MDKSPSSPGKSTPDSGISAQDAQEASNNLNGQATAQQWPAHQQQDQPQVKLEPSFQQGHQGSLHAQQHAYFLELQKYHNQMYPNQPHQYPGIHPYADWFSTNHPQWNRVNWSGDQQQGDLPPPPQYQSKD